MKIIRSAALTSNERTRIRQSVRVAHKWHSNFSMELLQSMGWTLVHVNPEMEIHAYQKLATYIYYTPEFSVCIELMDYLTAYFAVEVIDSQNLMGGESVHVSENFQTYALEDLFSLLSKLWPNPLEIELMREPLMEALKFTAEEYPMRLVTWSQDQEEPFGYPALVHELLMDVRAPLVNLPRRQRRYAHSSMNWHLSKDKAEPGWSYFRLYVYIFFLTTLCILLFNLFNADKSSIMISCFNLALSSLILWVLPRWKTERKVEDKGAIENSEDVDLVERWIAEGPMEV